MPIKLQVFLYTYGNYQDEVANIIIPKQGLYVPFPQNPRPFER